MRDKDGAINVHVAGYLTKDPKVTEKVVLFSVCYNSKGEKKYMDCRAWANDACGHLAACLEKHDTVVVDGIYESYTNKDGETKQQLAVDGIVPVTVPAAPAQPSEAEVENAGDYGDYGEDDGDLPF